jgi:hypothetical protein
MELTGSGHTPVKVNGGTSPTNADSRENDQGRISHTARA